MKILRPYPGIPAKKVKSWSEIKKEAKKLKNFTEGGDFEGFYNDAYAISHAQVSDKPKNFFCINSKIFDGKLEKIFGSWCIINLKILEGYSSTRFEEACMSFPHRQPKKTVRNYKIKVEYYIPLFNMFLLKRTKVLEGLPSYICQHENDHAEGKSIYFKD